MHSSRISTAPLLTVSQHALLPGGCLLTGRCLVPGRGAWFGGVSAPGGGGGIPACTKADPPMNRITDTCKNITLPQAFVISSYYRNQRVTRSNRRKKVGFFVPQNFPPFPMRKRNKKWKEKWKKLVSLLWFVSIWINIRQLRDNFHQKQQDKRTARAKRRHSNCTFPLWKWGRFVRKHARGSTGFTDCRRFVRKHARGSIGFTNCGRFVRKHARGSTGFTDCRRFVRKHARGSIGFTNCGRFVRKHARGSIGLTDCGRFVTKHARWSTGFTDWWLHWILKKIAMWRSRSSQIAGSCTTQQLLLCDIILQHLMISFCNIWWHHFELI